MAEEKTAQLRIRPKVIMAEGGGGTIFWATPSRARLLIDGQAVDLLNAPTIGPSETKPTGPLEKKPSAAVPDGRSTDSVPSSVPGKAAQLFASAADLVSPKRKSRQSNKREDL